MDNTILKMRVTEIAIRDTRYMVSFNTFGEKLAITGYMVLYVSQDTPIALGDIYEIQVDKTVKYEA